MAFYIHVKITKKNMFEFPSDVSVIRGHHFKSIRYSPTLWKCPSSIYTAQCRYNKNWSGKPKIPKVTGQVAILTLKANMATGLFLKLTGLS